ncbi:MAG: PadR family transcriptional regulator, partial [Acidobacteria bacterium]
PTVERAGGPGFDAWWEQLRRGALELAILLTLARESRYGLEIIRHLENRTDLVVAEGTIYPILARLTRDRLLESTWREEGVHPRKYYRLTERGRVRLERMTRSWEEFAGKMSRLIAAASGGRHEGE